ncbi:MAG: hypothetical protein JSW23_08480, partial [Planctomycetota bacterium]
MPAGTYLLIIVAKATGLARGKRKKGVIIWCYFFALLINQRYKMDRNGPAAIIGITKKALH